MSQKVVLLTQWFDPEPTFKGLIFAQELLAQGFEVEVVTGFPNYPGGQLYPGYKVKCYQKELINGVHVTRVPLYPSHDGSAIKRIFNYVSFAFTALVYCLFFLKKPKVIYAYHPPLTIGCIAVFLKMFRGISVVYDIQDMWPDTLRATGMISNKRVLFFIGWVAGIIYKRVDQIVVLSPGFKKLLVERGVPFEKIEVIPNWCDEAALQFKVKVCSDIFTSDKFKVVFAGNLGKAQALNSILEAADILQGQVKEVVFIFLGAGVEVENLKGLVAKRKLTNVFFHEAVPMSEVGSYLNLADILLVHLRKDPLFEITIPSKTQAYMAIGKPIIMGVRGDAASIILEAHCGVVVEPENAIEIAEAVVTIFKKSKDELDKMASNAKEYYQENLSLKIGTKRFGHIFSMLAQK